MKSTAFACALVLVVFGLCQGVRAGKPKITPTLEEIVIQEGDELKIQCHGDGKVQFSTQETIVEIEGSEFNMLNETSHTLTFIRPRTRKEDTGWYACAEEGVLIQNDEQNIDHESNDIAWIYVYVNSSAPFAIDADFELLVAVSGGRLIVPCRTTSPNSTVKLDINWGLTEVPENTKYDPKIGFILSEVGKELCGQIFECQVEGSESIFTSYTLQVTDPPSLDKPRINGDQIEHVVWGTDLTVDCEIDVRMGTSFAMSWKVPESVPKEKWSCSPEPIRASHTTNGFLTWITKLTIKNFEASDDGKYYCGVAALMDQVESSVDIKSWDPSYTYINVTVDGSNEVTSFTGKTAQWKIQIDTYPQNVSLKWYTPDEKDTAINPDENSKYSYVREGSNLHFFGISELTIEDSGNYTIEFSNGNIETSISLSLKILDRGEWGTMGHGAQWVTVAPASLEAS